MKEYLKQELQVGSKNKPVGILGTKNCGKLPENKNHVAAPLRYSWKPIVASSPSKGAPVCKGTFYRRILSWII